MKGNDQETRIEINSHPTPTVYIGTLYKPNMSVCTVYPFGQKLVVFSSRTKLNASYLTKSRTRALPGHSRIYAIKSILQTLNRDGCHAKILKFTPLPWPSVESTPFLLKIRTSPNKISHPSKFPVASREAHGEQTRNNGAEHPVPGRTVDVPHFSGNGISRYTADCRNGTGNDGIQPLPLHEPRMLRWGEGTFTFTPDITGTAHVYLYFIREDGTAFSPSRYFRVETGI